jgi:HK97 family phage prohead protease
VTVTDLRRLPQPVLDRLADADIDARAAGIAAVQRGKLVEARARKIETRSNDDGTVGLSGYATVYDTPYDVGGAYGWSEVIAAGACAKSVDEKDDVRCLLNHDGIPMGRTKPGTMTLTSDDVGLYFEVPSLDLNSPYVASVASALARCDLDECSFAFIALRDDWSPDYLTRTIREVQLFDVSVVTYPANPATVVGLRSQPQIAAASGLSLRVAQAVATSLRARAS